MVFEIGQELSYEDDKIAYKGYAREVTDMTVTICFDPYTVSCQEGVIYKGTGKETVKVYDTGVYSHDKRMCTPAEVLHINDQRKKYKQELKEYMIFQKGLKLLYERYKVEDIASQLSTPDKEITIRFLIDVLTKGRLYLLPEETLEQCMQQMVRQLHKDGFSLLRIKTELGLKMRRIKAYTA